MSFDMSVRRLDVNNAYQARFKADCAFVVYSRLNLEWRPICRAIHDTIEIMPTQRNA